MAEEKTEAQLLHEEDTGCKFCLCWTRWLGVECCCCHGATANLKMDIEHDRFCTDVPCCLVFLGVLLAELALFSSALSNPATHPEFLVFYTNWEGNLCKPHTFNGSGPAAWPDIRMYDIRVCLPTCEHTLTDPRIVTPDLQLDWRDLRPVNGTFSFGGYKSRELLGAYCLPDTRGLVVDVANQGKVGKFLSRFDSVGDAWSRSTSDMITARWLFVICVFTAVFVSFLYGFLMRKVGFIIVWLSIALTIGIIIFVGFILIRASEAARAFGYTTTANAMYYTGVGLTTLGIILIFVVFFMWDRIRLAIKISEETSYAFESMKALMIWPLIPFVATVVWMVYWIIAVVFMTSVTEKQVNQFPPGANVSYYNPPVIKSFLSSAKDALGGQGAIPVAGTFQAQTLLNTLNPPKNQYTKLVIASNWKYAVAYHWFVMLWVLTFISYHSYMVIAGAYAEWYFAEWEDEATHLKKYGEEPGKMSRCPVTNSCGRTTRYHLGTIAFGSGIIAVITFAEHSLAYIERQVGGENPNPIQKAIFICIACCLRCMRCIFDRINKNGLIVTSVHGSPFCSASFQALSLIFRNILRASALSAVNGYLEFIGKIAILCMNMFICLMIIRFWLRDQLSSVVAPMFLCGIITFTVAIQYMYIFEVGIQTVFICFLIDEEANGGKQKMRAHQGLLDIIGAARVVTDKIVTRRMGTRRAPGDTGDTDNDHESLRAHLNEPGEDAGGEDAAGGETEMAEKA